MQDIKSIKKYLINYFSNGAKNLGDYNIGVELEHFVLEKNSLKNVSYFSYFGVEQILYDLQPYFPVSYTEEGKLLGLANNDYSITLEPGSQLEISITPQESIKRIEEIYISFLKTIRDTLENNEYILATSGYLPASSIYDILLLPKKRYAFMDRYFSTTGSMGINMMRGTASCQVSIDYFGEADFVRKTRCAYLISPILSYMASNSPVFEGDANNNLLLRTLIWRNTDKLRAGVITGLFSDDFGFEKYADYVLNAPAIFRISNGSQVETKLNVLDVMKETDDIPEAAELYISLMFPDVRLKQYIEIRVADSMPIERTLGYAAFIKGLFVDPCEVEALFKKEHFNENSIIMAQNNLMRNNPFVYGVHINTMIEKLVEIARNRLSVDERAYLQDFIDKR